ncbi:hypothetical protein BGZ96_000444 [Linnemannia gamsii]|uniref:Uncharacterized protein n=1 Tax=Linnemannia gamsii TaxID=64522 RepID=A0ABQ7KCV6_9FUNG|nr:hypothetical protein BGZ96_000444 [Linnemannia gamsii]
MTRFLKWLLDPVNQKLIKEAGTPAGLMKKDLYQEAADLVNTESTNRTDKARKPWTAANAKYNIRSSESKYRMAKARLNETGTGDNDQKQLLKEVRKICPQLNPSCMIHTTTIPGEATESYDDNEKDEESGESEGDEGGGVGDMGVDGEVSDEDEGCGDDMRELEPPQCPR